MLVKPLCMQAFCGVCGGVFGGEGGRRQRLLACRAISLSNSFEKAENFRSESSKVKKKRRMVRKTFVCDESMIITIPIGGLGLREDQLMPEKFHCVFKDSYKIFVIRGKPRPLGAVQAIAGIFLFILGVSFADYITKMFTLPSVVFLVSGMLSYAAGKYSNIHVAKLSFSLNIIGFFWSLAAFCLNVLVFHFGPGPYPYPKLNEGVRGLIISLLVVENLIALFLIYWLSKAVCRSHFNTLPTILLKRAD
ncbi:uncharacterized protein LOC127536491 isoform X3 [Acanthochromis polyacanthus]|uniref:uncharacterized protein LOC127536491 isoform X2 n=1 Tax=Acanthochromis polyacanthus TaxID=80966 RepID=UPI0022343B52|nr:uncharacterized protein LOC127536491 isoform X2 [Acanthochromis polyacanthus]XP_051813031.1 uncharacterized protein LOC127536491 isoform X3 [Acanthochromis polyacanthus]